MAWAAANIGLLFLIAWLLAPHSRALTRATGLPLALYLLAFYPVMYVLGEGQDSLLFALLVVLSLRSMDSGQTFLAGFLLALACFKFHLALLITFFVLILRGKWRGVVGFVSGGGLVCGISLALVGSSIFHDYPAMLQRQEVVTPWGFIPWFMPNLRGFLQWVLAHWLDTGTIFLAIFLASAVVGGVAMWLVLRNRKEKDESMVYAVAILTTILVGYHLHMQDLSLAMLPMVVLCERALLMYGERGAAGVGTLNARVAVLAVAIAALYLYRIAGEAVLIVLMRGCLLAVPIFVLWLVALRWWAARRLTMLASLAFLSESATIPASSEISFLCIGGHRSLALFSFSSSLWMRLRLWCCRGAFGGIFFASRSGSIRKPGGCGAGWDGA
ncbi:MAG TPA: glycosyltransferase 87 family protein [Terriglobales bacterium]